TVDDRSPVRAIYSREDLTEDVGEDPVLEFFPAQTRRQRLAMKSLEHEKRRAARKHADVVDGANVGMVHRRDELRLAREALQSLPGIRIDDDFDGYRSPQD